MIADWLPSLLLAWSIQLMGVVSPGPGVALILGVATSEGRRAGVLTCVGICIGSSILAMATIVGLAAVLSELAWAMTLVKLAGAAFLAWLAWGAFRKAANPPPLPVTGTVARSARGAMLAGFAMQITNAKAMVFWMAIAALGSLNDAPLPVLAVFVAGVVANSFCGHGAWAIALSSRPFLALNARARRWIEGALGVFFSFAACKLATART
jgi:threonine/homoserine/homoserine lactone efflux protein